MEGGRFPAGDAGRTPEPDFGDEDGRTEEVLPGTDGDPDAGPAEEDPSISLEGAMPLFLNRFELMMGFRMMTPFTTQK